MKKYFLIFILFALVTSCDPGYRVYFINKSYENIYINTKPPIERDLIFKTSLFYDSIVSKKENKSDIYGIYKIKPNDKIFLYGDIGFVPGIKKIPFDYILLKNEKDSILLDTKEKILENIKQVSRAKRYYVIEVKDLEHMKNTKQ